MQLLKIIGMTALIFISSESVAGQCKPYPDCKEVLKDPEKYASTHSSTPDDGSLDVMDIISASKSMSCVDWKVIGVCVWLKYEIFSVSIRTSLKVSHYIPDLVISAYKNKGENPWSLMSWTDDLGDATNSLFGLDLKGGNIHNKKGGRKSPSTILFKHTTAIANPLASVYGQGFLDYFMCQSGVTSFVPYYNSVADGMLWRTAAPEFLTEALELITPGKSIVGERDDGEQFIFTGRWGNVYPRTGFVNIADDYKAAAVATARTASIVTDTGAAIHVHQSANGSSKKGYWPASEVNEYDSESGKYQMLFPRLEDTCHIFGSKQEELFADEIKDASEGKDLTEIGDKYSKERTQSGDYAHNLWRKYRCCRKEGQVLMMHTGN